MLGRVDRTRKVIETGVIERVAPLRPRSDLQERLDEDRRGRKRPEPPQGAAPSEGIDRATISGDDRTGEGGIRDEPPGIEHRESGEDARANRDWPNRVDIKV